MKNIVALIAATFYVVILAENPITPYNHDNLTTNTLPNIIPNIIPKFKNIKPPILFKRAPETKNLQNELDIFIGKLKSFVHDTNFDTTSFELSAQSLEDELAGIATCVEKVARRNSKLLTQLQFSKTFFQTMADSLEYLRLYKVMGPPEHRYLHLVIHLNVILLALYDKYGIPDPAIENFALKVSSFSKSIVYWEEKFNALEVSYGTRRLFRTQLEEAKKAIHLLKESILEQQTQPNFGNRAQRAFSRFKSQFSLP